MSNRLPSFPATPAIPLPHRYGGIIDARAELAFNNFGDVYHLSGSGTVKALPAMPPGPPVTLILLGATTFTHSSKLLMPGATSRALAAGDAVSFIPMGDGLWRCIAIAEASGAQTVSSTTDATDSSTGGALTVAGGLAVAKQLFVGLAATISGILKTTDTTNVGAVNSGSLQAAGGAYIAKDVLTNGNIKMDNASNPTLQFYSGSKYFEHIAVTATGAYLLVNAGATAGVQLASQAATSWSAFSDRRIKTDVETLSVLDKLNNFRAVRFTNTLSGDKEIGAIAQELVGSFFELVTFGDDDDADHVAAVAEEKARLINEAKRVAKSERRKLSAGDLAALDAEAGDRAALTVRSGALWSVAYDRFGVVALQGVKELCDLVRAQAGEIAELRRRLDAMTSTP